MKRAAAASQETLCREATGLVRSLGLMKLARGVGRAWLVGSVPLKLIVKPDIDIHVLVPRRVRNRESPESGESGIRAAHSRDSQDSRFAAWSGLDAPEVPAALAIAKGLLERGIHRLELLRFLFRDAVKIGFDTRVGERTWHVDVWVTSDPENLGTGPTRWVRRRLTPELRAAILKLKRYYAKRDMCRFGMSGELYKAVIQAGVRTPRQFLAYARTHELNYTDVLRMLEADARTWGRRASKRSQ
ncbi:MAG TPA: hypothetical protein PLE19_01065 [Planctomycetota bacterium]|nr:hypothetical protein [Planctomycetota bacterium]HRR79403.1 hypothetical protein [Planctomycetota bacterium]HRT93504.1 hypothetical protein [Planctomycetota bacterium]